MVLVYDIMEHDSISRVMIVGQRAQSSSDDGDSSKTWYNDVEVIIILQDEGAHVWLEGTNYVEQGTASKVTEGDIFLQFRPEKQIFQVVDIDQSMPSSELNVEIEYLYAPNSTKRDKVSVDGLTKEIHPLSLLEEA